MGVRWMKAQRFFWNTIRETFDGVHYVADAGRWFCARHSIALSNRIEDAEAEFWTDEEWRSVKGQLRKARTSE